MTKELYLKWVKMLFGWHDDLEKLATDLHIDDIYDTGMGRYFDTAVTLFKEAGNFDDYEMDIFFDILWDPNHQTHVTVVEAESGMADRLNIDIDEFYNLCIDKEHFN